MQQRQDHSGEVIPNPVISSAQCRAARALLELSRAELAKAAAVGERTIADFESGSRAPIRATLAAIRRGLEAAGVEFLPDNGVRLKPGQVEVSACSSDQDAVRGTLNREPDQADKTVASKPRRAQAKPLAMPKEAQIRAPRERSQ